jgi:hypothetical protein
MAEEKSPLLKDTEKQIDAPRYSNEEQVYFKNLVRRIVSARDERDEPHDEFDGMTYLQYCEANRKLANSYVEPKKQKYDNNFVSGIVRQKLFAYLSAINNLDLSSDVQAYNDKNKEERALGEGMEDIMWETCERDGEGGDEEKKLLRQYTLFEQGTVFVREAYVKKWKIKKKLKGKFNGKINSVTWSKRLAESFEGCSRQILLNENVILGNMREYEMAKQPFFVDIDVMPYEEAKTIYGKWERWENVPKGLTDILSTNRDEMKLYNPFKLYKSKESSDVEVVRYQSKIDNEMMIMINGVMMLPVGFPMMMEEYDVAKQTGPIISPFFAYGRSIVYELRNNATLYDEMLRLALKKTQKSFAPPMFNMTGRTLSPKIFVPGTITVGVKEGQVVPVDPRSGAVEGGELNIIQLLQAKIDEKSVNPVFSGQNPSGGVQTATQILEVQRQAKQMISLTVTLCSLLEFKLGWLRLQNILKHWFEPTKVTYNEYTGEFGERYMSVVRDKMIPGAGKGKKITRITKNIPPVEEQIDEENVLSTPETPVRITYIDPTYVKSAKLIWYINVLPKEKKSDALSKIMFNEMMQGAVGFPNVNMDYLSERYAEIWEENPAKLFSLGQEQPAPTEPGAPAPTGSKPSPLAGVPQNPTPANKSNLLTLASSMQ